MQELSLNEIEGISGGWVAPFLVGTFVSPYMYDAVGGLNGINNYINKSWISMQSSVNYLLR